MPINTAPSSCLWRLPSLAIPLLLPGLQQWELVPWGREQARMRWALPGRGVRAAGQGGVQPPRRGVWGQGEVKGPLPLPSQTQHCHLKEPGCTAHKNAREPGISVDPCHQSHSSKLVFNFYI